MTGRPRRLSRLLSGDSLDPHPLKSGGDALAQLAAHNEPVASPGVAGSGHPFSENRARLGGSGSCARIPPRWTRRRSGTPPCNKRGVYTAAAAPRAEGGERYRRLDGRRMLVTRESIVPLWGSIVPLWLRTGKSFHWGDEIHAPCDLGSPGRQARLGKVSSGRATGGARVCRAAASLMTKLHPPPGRTRRLHATVWSTASREARASKLTLVAAPAGYGKTTLLGTWRELEQRRGRSRG